MGILLFWSNPLCLLLSKARNNFHRLSSKVFMSTFRGSISEDSHTIWYLFWSTTALTTIIMVMMKSTMSTSDKSFPCATNQSIKGFFWTQGFPPFSRSQVTRALPQELCLCTPHPSQTARLGNYYVMYTLYNVLRTIVMNN